MLKNYFRSAIRFLKRSKIYTAINLAGLSVGLAAAILIGLWIKNELSYDRYNKNADHIYRVTTHVAMGKVAQTNATSSFPVSESLRKIPGVKNAACFRGLLGTAIIKYNNKELEEKHYTFTDSNFFKVFTVKFLEGDPNSSLRNPNSIVITKAFADKLFGSQNPIGKIISLNYMNKPDDYLVTGEIEDFPDDSHFHFDLLISSSTLKSSQSRQLWYANMFYTYFTVSSSASLNSIKQQINNIVEHNLGKPFVTQYQWRIDFQKLTDIHLYSHLFWEIETNGNIKTLFIYLSIGVIILLRALINFVSLSTARYSDRAKEIGIRKVAGADRKKLIFQFTGESLLVTFIAAIAALSLAEIALPYFNELTNGKLSISFYDLLLVLASCLVIGVLAGSYPAFFLSSLKPSLVLKKDIILKRGGIVFRKGLVVFQFILAAGIIISSIIIAEQLDFVNNKDLGFNKNNVIVIPMLYQDLFAKYPILKSEFGSLDGVIDVSGSSEEIGVESFKNQLKYKDQFLFATNWLAVDYNFINTLGIKLLSGRNFSKDIPSDTNGAMLVNEAAAEKLKELNLLDKPLGLVIQNISYKSLHVVGVIGNFNYMPLYDAVKPLFFVVYPNYVGTIYVRINSQNISHTISELKEAWDRIVPQHQFDYNFLDKDIESRYKNDSKLGSVLFAAAFLSILISMLGLLGLINFTVEKKVKEIGIRKVHGASVSDIITLLSKDFAKLIIIADIIACPIAYYYMNKWLQNFAYRINITAWVFIGAFVVTFIAAFATVSYQTFKAASANPVKTLRYE